MTSFQNDIQHYFNYLFEKFGFKFLDLEDDYGGNIAVAQSDTLRIGFARDRTDFFLDIGRIEEPETWIGFYEIMDWLKEHAQVQTGYKHSNEIRSVSRLLKRYFPEIQAYLAK